MNSVPPETRGAASGMRATMQNTAMTASLAIFFTIVIFGLASSLPHALSGAITTAGAPEVVAADVGRIPPTTALFAAFLGYNPVKTILAQLPANDTGHLSNQTISTITGNSWFPNAIAPSFLQSMDSAFYIGAVLSFLAAVASMLRGKRYVHGEMATLEEKIDKAEREDEERIRKIEEELEHIRAGSRQGIKKAGCD
jgi:hypothetical protein